MKVLRKFVFVIMSIALLFSISILSYGDGRDLSSYLENIDPSYREWLNNCLNGDESDKEGVYFYKSDDNKTIYFTTDQSKMINQMKEDIEGESNIFDFSEIENIILESNMDYAYFFNKNALYIHKRNSAQDNIISRLKSEYERQGFTKEKNYVEKVAYFADLFPEQLELVSFKKINVSADNPNFIMIITSFREIRLAEDTTVTMENEPDSDAQQYLKDHLNMCDVAEEEAEWIYECITSGDETLWEKEGLYIYYKDNYKTLCYTNDSKKFIAQLVADQDKDILWQDIPIKKVMVDDGLTIEELVSQFPSSGNSIGWDVSTKVLMDETEEIDFTGLDIGSNEDISSIFRNTTAKKITWKNETFENVKIFNNMFDECRKLETIDFPDATFENGTEFDAMFNNCTNLKTVVLPQATFDNAEVCTSMFSGDNKLEKVHFPKATFRLADGTSMFEGCNNIKFFKMEKATFDKIYEIGYGQLLNYIPRTFDMSSLPKDHPYYVGFFPNHVDEWKYRCVFYRNDGTDKEFATRDFDVDEKFKSSKFKEPKRRFYDFVGWSTDQNADPSQAETEFTIDGSAFYYAIWQETLYDISFYKNDGTDDVYEVLHLSHFDTLDDLEDRFNTEREGYIFLGWSVKPNSKKGKATIGEIRKDQKYYAIWQSENTNINLYMNDGTDNIFTTIEGKIGNKINFKEATREDYYFVGWSKDKNSDTGVMSAIVEDDSPFYAIWKETEKWEKGITVPVAIRYEGHSDVVLAKSNIVLNDENFATQEAFKKAAGISDEIWIDCYRTTIVDSDKVKEQEFNCEKCETDEDNWVNDWSQGKDNPFGIEWGKRLYPMSYVEVKDGKPQRKFDECITIWSHAEKYKPSIKLTIDFNGGALDGDEKKEIEFRPYRAMYAFSDAPVREGYNLVGYGTKKDSNKLMVKIGKEIKLKKDMTYYAIWEKAE